MIGWISIHAGDWLLAKGTGNAVVKGTKAVGRGIGTDWAAARPANTASTRGAAIRVRSSFFIERISLSILPRGTYQSIANRMPKPCRLPSLD